jgi:hypothetical protein
MFLREDALVPFFVHDTGSMFNGAGTLSPWQAVVMNLRTLEGAVNSKEDGQNSKPNLPVHWCEIGSIKQRLKDYRLNIQTQPLPYLILC